uniref:Protein kinase domain-containing protein n=1 Tax=Coccidioides posadasii RMSCC 3488 TaxID=454284 RepID=A0A0J6FQM8_COCPO|nr:hypothetical protein CPAG_07626 [Coccidioides posadasii RMSCC 3488]
MPADIKMDNVLVKYAPSSQNESGQRFTDVQLADLESTVHITSRFCKDRDEIGTPIWRSPEAQLGLQWGPPTDIWSFGTMEISMIWGDNFFIFKPKFPRGHDEYELEILAKYHIYFGPYPPSYVDLADQETLGVLSLIMKDVPPEKLRPFSLASQREISEDDKEFVLKIMKLDPRDRPDCKGASRRRVVQSNMSRSAIWSITHFDGTGGQHRFRILDNRGGSLPNRIDDRFWACPVAYLGSYREHDFYPIFRELADGLPFDDLVERHGGVGCRVGAGSKIEARTDSGKAVGGIKE